MEAELKLVLHLGDGHALVGVQGKGTDPVLETLEAGSLEELLGAVPGVVARARERWAASPRNPKYEGPPPPPAPSPTVGREPAAARPSVATERLF